MSDNPLGDIIAKAQATPTPPSAPTAQPQAAVGPKRDNPLGDIIAKAQTAPQQGNTALQRITGAAIKTAAFPLNAVNAILGAPERAVSGLIGAQPGQNRLGAAVYEVFHPSQQQQFDIQGERNLGLGGLRSQDPRLRGKIARLALDFGYENLTDPLNVLFGVGVARRAAMKLGGAAITRGGELLENALNKVGEKVGGEKFAQAGTQAVNMAVTGANRLRKFTPLGRAEVNTAENRAHQIVNDMKTEDAGLLERNEKELMAGKMTPEVSSRLLQWAYILGSPAVRKQAVGLGVKITPEMAKLPVLNILPRMKLRYEPKTRAIDPTSFAPIMPGFRKAVKTGEATFIKTQGAKASDRPLFDRVAERLASYHNQLGARGFLAKTFVLDKIAPMGASVQHVAQYVKDPVDVMALRDWLQSGAGPGSYGYRTEAMLRQGAFEQALHNLGYSPETMRDIANDPLGRMPFKSTSRALPTKPLLKYLSGRTSVKAGQHTPDVEKSLQNIQGAVASAGQKGVTRAERFGKPPAVPAMKGAARRAETQVGKLQASAAKTAGEVTEPILRERGKLMGKLTRREQRRIERDAAINREIGRRERYNKALSDVNAEADRILNAELDRLVPKGVLEEVFPARTISGGVQALQSASEAGRQALFINPIVHGIKNASTLQFLGPAGMKGVVRGWMYAAGMMPQARKAALEVRLKDVGAGSDFVRAGQQFGGITGRYAKLTGPAKNVTQGLEHGQRIALLDFLDHDREYKGLSDAEKGQLINDVMVDYLHQSPLARSLKGIGAPFPHWRLTMVARMVHAFMEQPHRMNMLARFATDFNRELLSDKPYGIEFATPATDIKALMPGHAMQYAATTGGPATTFLRHGVSPKIIPSAEELAGRYLPGGNLLLDLLGWSPYANKATEQMPGWQKTLLDLIGAYPQKNP